MDFGTLLHVAKKNSETSKDGSKYYSTKYGPPKKESKEKKLSQNIQKFLQKREEEERERQRTEKDKLNKLLAMRDEKSKNKIRKMLKVTKSANKSVLDDAVNSEHTAVTMEGPEQPDQDDYGYVSTEANAFYQKYIEKVKDVKDDKGFAPSRPQSLRDLSGTKERVKAAITKEIEDKRNHVRTRTVTSTTTSTPLSNKGPSTHGRTSLYDPEAEKREEDRKKREEEQKKAKNRKPPPPPLDFQALLKLAEKKQNEPIEILPVIKKKEPERLLTLKEKRELEERQQAKEAREKRDRERNMASKDRKDSDKTPRVERSSFSIPKIGQAPKLPAPSSGPNKPISKASNNSTTSTKTLTSSSSASSGSGNNTNKSSSGGSAPTSLSSNKSGNMPIKKVPPSTARPANSSSSKSTSSSSSTPAATTSSSSKSSTNASATNSKNGSIKNPYNGPTRDFPPRDFPPRDMKSVKPREMARGEPQKTRQFPPADVRRVAGGAGGGSRMGDNRKPPPAQKKRILDDSDEDEYDSEMDDFIDDGDCEMDYSSAIKQIFGYDKSRYRNIEDDDDDDAAMESNFAQQQREEFISKKIGLQEDLDDMKMEAIEKKRKMMKKKRLN